jgi:anti-sigma regulatory factor (Ser/Thr protein kinase)
VNHERRFPHTTASVTEARHFVLDALSDVPRESREVIAVMVSELATNALRHAATPFSVRVEQTARAVRVDVTDGGDGAPAVRTPGPGEPTGRGLRIVEGLSDAWGVEPLRGGTGKTVWFTVSVPSSSTERWRESG